MVFGELVSSHLALVIRRFMTLLEMTGRQATLVADDRRIIALAAPALGALAAKPLLRAGRHRHRRASRR
jgi:hypothetical protein